MFKKKRGGSRLDTSPNANAKKQKKGRMPRWAKILIVVLAVLIAAAIVGFAVYKSWAVLPDIDLPAASQTPSPETGELPSQHPMANAQRKNGFYTFLVTGRDTGGGGNTDTMMLVAYDIPNQKLSVMSLPRDTMVDAHYGGSNRKLNGVWNLSLYYAKKGEKKEGIEYLKEAIGEMTGFVPDFYVVVNWQAFGRLVDAIGGVEFEVPFNMVYQDPTQDLYINVAKGKRVLTGEEAMGVVRWRHNNSMSQGYATGDLGRIETQQALMKEVVRKLLRIQNVTKISEFASIFVEEVETDLTIGNLAAFAERAIFGGLKMENVTFSTMPYTPVTVKGVSYVEADPEELLGLLNDSFNPYKKDLTMNALHILQYKSSTGYYIYTGDANSTGKAPTYTDPQAGGVTTSQTHTPKPTKTPTPAPSADTAHREEQPSADTADREETPATTAPEETPSTAPAEEQPSAGMADREEPPATAAPEEAPPTVPAEEPSAAVPDNEVPAGIPMD